MKTLAAQVLVGSALASSLIAGVGAWREGVREAAPASGWLEVGDLAVPDFVRGDDPAIIFRRTIHQNFTARRIAEIQAFDADQSGFAMICTGNGENDYKTKDVLPKPVKLSWFMSKECSLPPGRLRLCATWTLTPAGYPTKVVRSCSNSFRVRKE